MGADFRVHVGKHCSCLQAAGHQHIQFVLYAALDALEEKLWSAARDRLSVVVVRDSRPINTYSIQSL